MSLTTPILLCMFNRPELTRRVFECIRQQRPQTLLVVQDGPRANVASDAERIRATRDILQSIDWPCTVHTCFSSTNLGCRNRMASGISWGFSLSERLIVLEDDCLPDPSFFSYCEQLLDRYADCEDVLMISGDNFQPQRWTSHSYYFSKYAHIWGWASWRRAWQWYDLEMQHWPAFRDGGGLEKLCPDRAELIYWCELLNRQAAGEIDTWDYAWMFAGWLRSAWTILPETNLVSNIGFGADATHTTSDSPLAKMPVHSIGDLVHPPLIQRHVDADDWTWSHVFRSTPDVVQNTRPNWNWWSWLQPFQRWRRAA